MRLANWRSPAPCGSTASSFANWGPFGGSRVTGIGREGDTRSFDFFCDVKRRDAEGVFRPREA
jgi:hypothetical protein